MIGVFRGVMHTDKNSIFILVILIIVISCCFSPIPVSATGMDTGIILPVPEKEQYVQYLGLKKTAKGIFSLQDIDADILLIEIFNMYCPFCQEEADNVNELYQLMNEQEKNGIKMKIIGVGASNTELEVKIFKDTFWVNFPLFSDQDMSIYKKLEGENTPGFIGFLLEQGKDPVVILRESGGFDTAEEFLGLLLQRAGYR